MLLYKDEFIAKWMAEMQSRAAGFCEEGFVVPLIVLFYNDTASQNVLDSKRKMRIELAAIEKRHQTVKNVPWYFVGERLRACATRWRERMAVRIGVWWQQLPDEAVSKCLSSPEFEFLKYLHNLTQRMAAWRAFPDKHLTSDQLPKEFVDVKGLLDAPFSVYESLFRIQQTADAFIPAEMQRTMFAVMLSEIMCKPEQRTPAHRE
jgi:hypothetical protein